ncbi:PREDICTED: acyl-CoA synthetase family member 3, mitochondrial-like isoform X1 [Amphimedon queenslandica]|uniref:AMP-dependent synthetase/ligase domain-containing protein n=1 Tax=Amphimedon queenslandica TaxID=400682 RepID=A0A1X7TVU1_AMPQE|nr:PREDICTED: acyl-CoA synthetase family member 3, mitochondrial-like isoform X1 [Amphimedon queenslandica]|eukprot:XP_019857471.1 PREDICTED: acyl-CoA synthetase family member 3, mitochondrial-like isoform X1 [Amphimedon queenslandica]
MAQHPSFSCLPRLPFFLESRSPTKAALYWAGDRSPLTYGTLNASSDLFKNRLSEELHFKPSISELSSNIHKKLQALSPTLPSPRLHDTAPVSGPLNDPSIVYKIQPRIAFICDNNDLYVTSLYAIWKMGCIAVPLCKTHPLAELEYVLRDCEASLLLSSDNYKDIGHALKQSVGVAHLNVSEFLNSPNSVLNDSKAADNSKWTEEAPVWSELGAMILYTSGTTGHPKGVLLTHSNIRYHIYSLVSEWDYSEADVVLHALPLHHLHGILNILLCPLSCGASILMHNKFEPDKVWSSLLNKHDGNYPKVNVFSGVPTMYNRLLQYYELARYSNEEKEMIKNHCQSNIRLMMSGSSALPDSIFKRWKEVTGHALLERYGMTETGMVLSNLYKGHREPGLVGYPLPYNSVRLVSKDEDNNLNSGTFGEVEEGEIHLYGPGIFKGYWKKPEATQNAFTILNHDKGQLDGPAHWFVTGDIAECRNNVYKILGRASVDIIKSGGYKISALEIEKVILEHSLVSECAVIGVQDEDLGQKVVAIVIPTTDNHELSLEILKNWCVDKLAQYKVPRLFIIKDKITKNAMGKINKKNLANCMKF